MNKSLVVAALLSSIAVASFAQTTPAATDAAATSAPVKKHHVKHAKKPVTPASSPMASTTKTGGN